ILLDLNLPGMSGLDSIPFFRSAVESAKVIVLTQSDKEADVLRAINLGASGYLLKSSTVAQIKESIRTVMKGGASLDANVAAFILKTLKESMPNVASTPKLTLRETEILTLLAEGQSKKEISKSLEISVTTVVTHVGHIYEKLDARNAPDAIAKGFRKGILRIEDD
ncbi:MAG: response regulator transcription factor, partial [Verrucomicrobiota bacterium]